MSMHSPELHNLPLTQQRSEDTNEVVDLFTATERRMAERRPGTRTGAAPAEAIRALRGASNPVERYLANRRAREVSMRGYERKLRQTMRLLVEAGFEGGTGVTSATEFPWHRVTVSDADAFNRLLMHRYSSAKSRENYLGVVRSVLRQCARVGLIDRRTCDDLLDALPVRSGRQSPAGRELTDGELVALQRAAAQHPNALLAARDSALLAIFQSTGCRISEVADLDLADFRRDDSSLLLRITKSGRPVRVWLVPWAARTLHEWLFIRGDAPGPLLLSWRGERLTTSGIDFVLGQTAKRAELNRPMSSHDFRRTFITRMLRSGVDPFVVRRLVNQVNVATTLIYDRRTENEDRDAVLMLQLPDPDVTPRNHAGKTR